MRVHLTFDVEVWCQGWRRLKEDFPLAFRKYVYGPPPGESAALPLNLRILRDHGLKAVFFVEPLFSFCFGIEPLQEIVGLVLDAGQEVQLHLHPEWLDELAVPLIAKRSKTPNLHSLEPSEQRAVLSACVDRLVAAGAPRPTAFRSGNYSINSHTLSALSDNGIVVDSSVNPCFDFPYPGDAHTWNLDRCSVGGITEYPVTVFRDGFGKKRPLQVTACSSAEIVQALRATRDAGRSDATIVSHNFELLTPDLQREDRIVRRRFEKVCGWLGQHADEFPTDGFAASPVVLPHPAHSTEPLSLSRWATSRRHVEQLARRLGHFARRGR